MNEVERFRHAADQQGIEDRATAQAVSRMRAEWFDEKGARAKMSDVIAATVSPDWPGGDRTVRLYLALYMRTDAATAMTWAGQERLADDLGCSVRTVGRALDTLVKAGLVEKESGLRSGGDGQWGHNAYYLPPGPIEDRAEAARRERRSRSRRGAVGHSCHEPPVSSVVSHRSGLTSTTGQN